MTANNNRYKKIRNVTILGGIVDGVLGLVKIVIGYIAHSQSLLADGVHSLSDLITDFLVIWAAKEASKEPDAEHPYGHQRIETLATIILGAMLISVALGIGYHAIESLIDHRLTPTPEFIALVIAGGSVIAKEIIYRYTMHVANQVDSDLLRSNAWHSRSDALSSVVVIVGVTGALLGYSYLDAAAAVIVTAMIAWVGIKMIWKGSLILIDTGVSKSELEVIRNTIKSVEGVRDAHDLRTRKMGNEIFLDGHVLVNKDLSVSEGHRIGEAVKDQLNKEFKNITDITIHIDAENDIAYQKSSHLPLRHEIEALLHENWENLLDKNLISKITIHYLNGYLHIEVWIPLSTTNDIEDAQTLARNLKAQINDDRIQSIKILFE